MNKLKNIIVLKGMSSNIVDEAIVILKPNIKLKQNEYMSYEKYKVQTNSKRKTIEYEAEKVINTYIEKINNNIDKRKNIIIMKKYKILKIFSTILILTNILLIIFNF